MTSTRIPQTESATESPEPSDRAAPCSVETRSAKGLSHGAPFLLSP